MIRARWNAGTGWRIGRYACAALALFWAVAVVAPAPAAAQGKSRGKIAILGLEVEDRTGAPVTEEATRLAKDLTRALRGRADTPPQTYQLAPSSDKELIDEKLMNGCTDEAVPCMSKIAENLKSDYLLWGKIEKGKSGREDGYRLSLTLLKISTKQTSTYAGFLPNGQRNEAGVKNLAKDAYTNLTKGDSQGTLVIKSNVESGKILVDGKPAGDVVDGRGELSLPEGSYKVSVSAEGHRTTDEQTVSIEVGKTETQSVELLKIDTLTERTNTVSTRKSYIGWKVASVAGFAVAAGGTAWMIALQGPISDYRNHPMGGVSDTPDGDALGNEGCGTTTLYGSDESKKAFAKACDAYDNTWIAGGIIGVGAIVGFGSLFYVLTRDDAPTTERAAGRRTKRRPNVVVTPIVSPSNAGASFRIDW